MGVREHVLESPIPKLAQGRQLSTPEIDKIAPGDVVAGSDFFVVVDIEYHSDPAESQVVLFNQRTTNFERVRASLLSEWVDSPMFPVKHFGDVLIPADSNYQVEPPTLETERATEIPVAGVREDDAQEESEPELDEIYPM
ncbi:hypothetical protein D8Y22_05515 [Salinadaptatus halalkaliphilus]|uniref:Uncharacterized protein n=2 Tax=Salinadaptatus halalkaliphilus TaxID=2419781 RepID=A0A4S3TR65_9EURY|nr:hypothetical protein D8Y22_05515 [Salinadaptatus halalkaliphilus]